MLGFAEPRALAFQQANWGGHGAAVQQKWFGDRLRFCYAGSLRLGRRDPRFSRVRTFQITRIPSLQALRGALNRGGGSLPLRF